MGFRVSRFSILPVLLLTLLASTIVVKTLVQRDKTSLDTSKALDPQAKQFSTAIQRFVNAPEEEVDVGLAALTFAREIDPQLDVHSYSKKIDFLADRVNRFAGKSNSPDQRVRSLNTVLLLEQGFHGTRDLSRARKSDRYFLNHVLDTHDGNCLSMPLLYIAVATRLGWPVYLVHLPDHSFVRYVDPSLNEPNVETTSNGGYVTDQKYAHDFLVSDLGWRSGTYLRTLTHHETLSDLAAINGIAFGRRGDPAQAVAYLELATRLNPRNAAAWNNLLVAYKAMSDYVSDTELKKYSERAAQISRKLAILGFVHPNDIPPPAHAASYAAFALPTRYYDAAQGRFVSPDTIVQNPSDPQSLNRYSYVRNNPTNFIDPSGNSRLSSAINKVGSWVSQHREFAGLTWQAFDPLFGSIYLGSFDNGRAILAGEVIAAGSFGFGGTQIGWGAVSGELSSAYSARRTEGNMLTSVIRGGLEGAAISAVFCGISNTNASWVQKGLAKSIISAGLTAAQGGDGRSVGVSAALTFVGEAASSYFSKNVGYGPDPTPGLELDDPNHIYKPNELGQPPAGKDVFGYNTPEDVASPMHQGSVFCTSADKIPGMNAVAELHDVYRNLNPYGNNVLQMLPAAIVSYGAQFAGPWAPFMILSH